MRTPDMWDKLATKICDLCGTFSPEPCGQYKRIAKELRRAYTHGYKNGIHNFTLELSNKQLRREILRRIDVSIKIKSQRRK